MIFINYYFALIIPVMADLFADIILPLAVRNCYTYRVPEPFRERAGPGIRVIVPFGAKKLYTGIIRRIHDEEPEYQNIKDITDVVDTEPVVNETQLKFWEWMAGYYLCYEGEVMKAALPSSLCPESETLLQVNPEFDDFDSLDEPSRHLINIIEKKKVIRLKGLPALIGNQNSLKLVNNLIKKNILIAGEKVRIKQGRPSEKYVVLARKFTVQEIETLLETLKKAPRQHALLSAWLDITGYKRSCEIIPVRKEVLLRRAGTVSSVISSLEKKGVFLLVDFEDNRDQEEDVGTIIPEPLSESQNAVYRSINEQLQKKNALLLHGVTSSGKTQIYIHLIRDCLSKGKQVLYLLPEIALTAQIVERLRKYFGKSVMIYHSRSGDRQKAEIWKGVMEKKYGIILGVRSSIFLPFAELGLIIVDEEHDSSYKQQDPAPRYHARDAAVMLGSLTGAATILGSATPSVESFFNAKAGKYGFAELKERYGKVNLPEIILVNTREAYRKKLMISHFSPQLYEAIEEALKKKEQVLLFRNRRGFSPYLQCAECGWIPSCENCAVKLTYHKEINRLVCHYCGRAKSVPQKCDDCGSSGLETRGFGTEKIEEEIKMLFPGARVARMDHDTTRRPDSFSRIIKDFEAHRIDVLAGTQMISKGLDFENLTVVGIMNADSLLNYPDFRSYERAFQLMAQVSGRAGRRLKRGKVIIQTSDPEHRIMRLVLRNDYRGFYESQLEERKTFNYPPFCRLVKITLKHRNKKILDEFAGFLSDMLRKEFGKGVLGPEYPVISKIQLWYLKEILVKIDRNRPLQASKDAIRQAIEKTRELKSAATLRIVTDVDPY